MKQRSISMGQFARRMLLFAFALTFTSATTVAQEVIATIAVGDSPLYAAVNPVTNKIYVANTAGNNVTVIDGTNNVVIKTVTVGIAPQYLAVNPVSNKIYVPNRDSNTVTVVDGNDNSIVKTVTVGKAPSLAAVNSVTNNIYVANYISNTVTVIDGTNDVVIKTVTVGTTPVFLAVNSVTNQIYVGNYKSNNVTVIDGTNNSSIKTITVGSHPYLPAVNPMTNRIYVPNSTGNNVTVIDGTNNVVIKTVTVDAGPFFLAVNPVTNRIYVDNAGSNDVSVIDGTNNSLIKTITVGSLPTLPAVNPVTNKIYVPNTDSNTVTVIDGNDNSIVKTVTVGSSPQLAAVNPVTNRVYVANYLDNTVSVIGGSEATALQFVASAPCRLVDTRKSKSPIQGGTSTAFNLPQLGGCKIPSTAAAYSLNVTVVPQGRLGYLTAWPTGEDQPFVSTMNSRDGRIKANAAIVPAGYQGAVSVYASNTTDVILDINGYFAPVGNSTLTFNPLTPCRVADTRNPKGELGGPYLKGKQERDLPVLKSKCGIPSSAQAYSFNFTAVPRGALGYLSIWPAGQKQPVVSTLNAPTGAVTANAAIVPAGTGGDITVYASNDSDLVIDVNGYFDVASNGGLSLYPVAPCRALDTRNADGQFVGALEVDVVESACSPSETAQAYVFNATVVPKASLGYLTLWPDGDQQPYVSTLNAYDGAITSNLAIVPTSNGWIDAFSSNPTQLILDISSYFAP